jgi:hypothetical protein
MGKTNKRANKAKALIALNATTTGVESSNSSEVLPFNQIKAIKCDPIYDTTNVAAWIIYLNESLLPFAGHHTVTEYLTKGTINGTLLEDYKIQTHTWPEIAARVINKNNYENTVGTDNDKYSTRITAILNTYPWAYDLLFDQEDLTVARRMIHPNHAAGDNGVQHDFNITKLRSMIPGLRFPEPVALAAMIEADRIKLIREYEDNFGPNFPKSNAEIRARIYRGTDPYPLLHVWEKEEIREKIYKITHKRARVTPESLVASYEAKLVLNPALTQSLKDHCLEGCDASISASIEKEHENNKTNSTKSIDFINGILSKASTVTNKFQGPVRDLCAVELAARNHHKAFIKVLNHFSGQNVHTIKDLENSVRAIKIQLGQTFATHWAHVLNGFILWSSTIAIQRHLSRNTTNTIDNFQLNMEMVSDSSGFLSDNEYSLKHNGAEPYIPHSIRVSILMEGLVDSEVLKVGIDLIRTKTNPALKTMQFVHDTLKGIESDSIGQKVLKKQIADVQNRYNNKRPSSNLAAGRNPEDPCHIHGDNHLNKDCRSQKTNNNDNNPSKKRKGNNNNNNNNNNNGGKKKNKYIYTGPPCEYCLKFPQFEESAVGHPNSHCYRDPMSPAAKPNMIPKSVQLSHQINSSMSPLIQQMQLANQELAKSMVTSFKEAINGPSGGSV